VPLFDGNDDSIILELQTVGKKPKQLTCQWKKGDAYIVCCESHVEKKSKKCRKFSLNCSRHALIANNSLQVRGFQALVILYILTSKKQSAYKGRGSTNDDHCHPFQADLWESLLENHLSTNDDSLGTERIDSAPDKADANLAQYCISSNNEDGGTGTCTRPSADPKADAIESSVVGEKGDDHEEKKYENEDNINGAGKG
jgi:hypothetical protein